jgi:succinate dehydrogenase hydrophobic anchor subunit
VTIFYYISGVVFAFYVLGVIVTVYENHYKPYKYWESLQKVRNVVDEDIELIAAKKRHPAGKRRG